MHNDIFNVRIYSATYLLINILALQVCGPGPAETQPRLTKLESAF